MVEGRRLIYGMTIYWSEIGCRKRAEAERVMRILNEARTYVFLPCHVIYMNISDGVLLPSDEECGGAR